MRDVQTFMESHGVHRNSADNGVFLPTSGSTNQGGGRALPHSRVHTNNARDEVRRRIMACNNGDEIRRELAAIRQEMLNGDTRYLSSKTKPRNATKAKKKGKSKCGGK